MALSVTVSDESVCAVLRRLFAGPEPMRVFSSGQTPGLFPSNAVANRRLLESILDMGFVELSDAGSECRLTESGRSWLLEKESPRVLLEDLLRASELQGDELRRMSMTLEEMRGQFQRQSGEIRAVLGSLAGEVNLPRTDQWIETLLANHEHTASAADRSLAELFFDLRRTSPRLTVGQFHDAIRSLHEAGRIRLSPWTGPLYQLPEPGLALLIGHEVLYYVRLGRSVAA
ncbi:MAG: hypothetical protein U1D30_11865 [Planctomycetota bacterium]